MKEIRVYRTHEEIESILSTDTTIPCITAEMEDGARYARAKAWWIIQPFVKLLAEAEISIIDDEASLLFPKTEVQRAIDLLESYFCDVCNGLRMIGAPASELAKAEEVLNSLQCMNERLKSFVAIEPEDVARVQYFNSFRRMESGLKGLSREAYLEMANLQTKYRLE